MRMNNRETCKWRGPIHPILMKIQIETRPKSCSVRFPIYTHIFPPISPPSITIIIANPPPYRFKKTRNNILQTHFQIYHNLHYLPIYSLPLPVSTSLGCSAGHAVFQFWLTFQIPACTSHPHTRRPHTRTLS